MDPAPVLSIVICNYNTKDFLEQCLKSLRSEKFSSTCEIIVVDNHSPDESVAMVREKFPEVRLIANQENRWMTGGYNDGFRVSRGRYVCFLEPDTEIVPSAVETMLSFMKKSPDYGAVTCKTFLPDGTKVRACSTDYPVSLAFLSFTFLGKLFPKMQHEIFEDFRYREWDRESSREVEVIYGHCMLFFRDALETAGVFDELFRLYYSENDLCRRMKAKGWKSGYVALATVVHHERKSVERSGIDKIAKIYQEDICRYYRKYNGWMAASALWSLITVSNILFSIKQNRISRVLTSFLVPPKGTKPK